MSVGILMLDQYALRGFFSHRRADLLIFFLSSSPKELRERVLRGKYRIPFYMSTDCENLLKRFLVLNPIKRGTLEQIMKDRWINAGHEEDELKPFVEPELDISDQKRIGTCSACMLVCVQVACFCFDSNMPKMEIMGS